ncbi:MAG: IS3 family transposase [Terriglobia bacterium]
MAQAKRRRFTVEYKQRILAEADQAKGSGGIGALLRREGLYSSLLTTWRQEREAGVRQALTPQKRGPKSKRDPFQEETDKLRRENERLAEHCAKPRLLSRCSKKSGRAVGVAARGSRPGGAALMDAVRQLAPTVGIESACDVLGVARASFYRQRPRLEPRLAAPPLALTVRPAPARALSADERQAVRAVLHSERFQDCSPAAIQATLLDEGQYLCSTRTLYRVLEEDGATRERRDQLIHPPYQKPELLATAPNQLWSWDLTKLRGPAKWTYFYLYVILDVFSRYVVGWMVAMRESAGLASQLIEETCEKQHIQPGQLGIHADRGSAMRSKPVAFLLADLSVTKTHSRPYTSNDNPYSESQFRTLKYRPEFPDRFGCIQDSRAFCQRFFPWYNDQHRHSGIGMMTPAMVHYGQAPFIREKRQTVLDAAYLAHPDRFVRRPPTPLQLPKEVWINKPQNSDENTH